MAVTRKDPRAAAAQESSEIERESFRKGHLPIGCVYLQPDSLRESLTWPVA